STEDDRTMVDVLLEQKANGFATDNGWKEPALKAVVNALVGSEAVSGGTPKTVRSIRDHWSQLKKKYDAFHTLISLSGWGWDSENHRVQAMDE
ncbi:hypothetical protein DFH05DRAFT_1363854, partial [Lentinula detonsa]